MTPDPASKSTDENPTPSPIDSTKVRPQPSADPGGALHPTVSYHPPAVDPFASLPATFGRYRVLRLLGRGGMGAVYLAHDTQLDRKVALKVPSFSSSDGPQLRERFLREARAAATVQHANLCPVYDVGEIDGTLFLTMAFLEGKTLAEVLRTNRGTLTERQAGALVRKLALALAEAHRKKVIHRDLKPGNVMLNPRGEPIVMDFGLARRDTRKNLYSISDGSLVPPVVSGRPEEHLTQFGEIMGTPAYMAPEQAMGNPEEVGPACDIYSLGVILYELLAGRVPFQGEVMSILCQVVKDEPSPPSAHRSGLDPRMETICLRALAKKRERRYRTMAELAGVLTDYLKSGGPAMTDSPIDEERSDGAFQTMAGPMPPPPLERAPIVLPRRRGVPLWALGVVGVATAAVVGLGVWWKATRAGVEHRGDEERGEVRLAIQEKPGEQQAAEDRQASAWGVLTGAKEAYQKGDHARALTEATRAIEIDPRLAWAHAIRGEVYNVQGKRREAIADCTEALRLDPKLGWAFMVRGIARANLGETAKALDDLDNAIRLDPKNDTALINRASLHEAKGDLDRALADTNALLKLDSRDAKALVRRGTVLLRMTERTKAKADFDQAVKLDPTLATKVPVVTFPTLEWPRDPLVKGKLNGPALDAIKPWYAANFKNKEGALATSDGRRYRDGHYTLVVPAQQRRTSFLPIDEAVATGPFSCEAVARVAGPAGRWGLLVNQGDQERVSVTLSTAGVVFFRDGPMGPLTQVEPEPGKHPAVNKKPVKGTGQANRLMILVSGRYLEVYVNGKAVCDPVLLEGEITTPRVALLCNGVRMREVTAEFDRVVVRPAGSLPPLEKRGAKPKAK